MAVDLKLALFAAIALLAGAAWAGWWWRGRRPAVADSLDGEQRRLMARHHEFVGQLSHELRTPLTALLAHAAVARNPDTDAVTRQSSLRTIEHEAGRMARLVRDLLELHRLELGEDLPLVPTNAALVAEDVVSSLLALAEKRNLELSFAAAALPRVLAHPDRIRQVWLNVLANAIKYCRPGDSIEITLEAREDGVECRVRDSGPGIAAADLPHVAERLYRGRSRVEGNGLGLALASEILLRHGAALRIESSTDPPSGTAVWWVLPYA